VADGADGWFLVAEGNLSAPQTVNGRRCKVLQTSGSIYHKAEWVVRRPRRERLVSLRVRWRYEGADPIDVRIFTESRELLIGGELGGGSEWQEACFHRMTGAVATLDSPKQRDYGTGTVRIISLEFRGSDGTSVSQVRHGDPLTIRVRCVASQDVPNGHVTFVLGFARPGSPYAADICEHALPVPRGREFTIDAIIDSLRLGSGDWLVNLGVGEANMLLRETPGLFFTLDQAWYHFLAARLQFRVLSIGQLDAAGCFVVHPARVHATEERAALQTLHEH